MKTLYITNLGLLDNLAKTQILPYLEGLSRSGVSIRILSFEKKANLEGRAHLERVSKRLAELGITWSYLLYHNRWGNLIDLACGFLEALKISGRERIDVLHARASIPILIAWPLAKIRRMKVIYDRRGTMAGDFVDDVYVKNLFSIGAFSNILNGLDDLIVRHSDATIVLSDKALELLKKDKGVGGKQPVLVSIPCCADLSKFSDKGSPGAVFPEGFGGKFVITYLGSLGTCYLLKEMAEFFKVLKAYRPDSVFLIISHTDVCYIEGVLKGSGLAAGTDFIILKAEPEEVPELISKSDCSIMFIKPVLCKIGSSPTKFGESLAAGVPVIVNKGIGDTEEMINKRHIGVVVDELNGGSYEAAVKRLLGLIGEQGLKERCVDTARDHFSLELGVERYLEVYKKIEDR